VSAITLERPQVIAPAAPLTTAQEDALISLAVSTEKPARVRSLRREPRAWSLGGNVD
jgi:hypothetical protein